MNISSVQPRSEPLTRDDPYISTTMPSWGLQHSGQIANRKKQEKSSAQKIASIKTASEKNY